VADSFGLGIDAAADYPDDHSEPVNGVAYSERLVDFPLPRRPVKVLVHGFAIHQNRAAFVKVKTHLGDGSLTLARSVVIFLLTCWSLYQVDYLPYCCVWRSLIGCCFGRRLNLVLNLGLVRMLSASKDLQTPEHLPSLVVAGQHAFHGQSDDPLGMRFQYVPQLKAFEVTHVAAMPVVGLLQQFPARNPDPGRI